MATPQLQWTDLLTPDHTEAERLFAQYHDPAVLIGAIGHFLYEYCAMLPMDEYEKRGDSVYIHRSARVAPDAVLDGPVLVCTDAEIRCGAYLRGPVLLGARAVIGHACEVKNSILFQEAQVPHFNYVGDSIIGYRAHIGAGVILSNYRADHAPVRLAWGDSPLLTGRKKLGAILGDYSEIGCQSVLNPGTVIGAGSRVYPLCSVRGYLPPGYILKSNGEQIPLRGDH